MVDIIAKAGKVVSHAVQSNICQHGSTPTVLHITLSWYCKQSFITVHLCL